MKKDWLFRVRPDLFPQGMLTPLELELWGLYYEEKGQRFEARTK